MQAEVPPFQKAHEVLSEGKETLRHIIELIDKGRPVQNETHGIYVESVIKSLRDAAAILDDNDDATAAKFRQKAAELREFSKTVTKRMQQNADFNSKAEFNKLADSILALEAMQL